MTAAQSVSITRRPATATSALEEDLRREVDGEIRFDAGSRAAYSTDASNYRQVPIGVVVPRTVEAAVAAVAVCRRHGAPVLSRGGGTSLGGQCTNVAVVIDWTKYCNRMVSIDPERRRCVVEPGIVLDHLNELVAPHRLEYGPKPATHDHCTLGGMIGNNSCGSTAQRTGKVVDNVARLEVLLYDGTRMWVGPTTPDELAEIEREGGRRAEVYAALRALRDRHADTVRKRYPKIPRRVSGYNIDSLLDEQGFDVAKTLVGSEGTLVTVLHAELTLVPVVPAHSLVVLGFPDLASAGDAVPAVLGADPILLEAIDGNLIDFERDRRMNQGALALLPKGGAWLMIEVAGNDQAEADRHADELLGMVDRTRDDDDVTCYDDAAHEADLSAVREAALGATARVHGQDDCWPGWEDSAVDPSDLGDYLRDLTALLDEYGYLHDSSLYGHFGQGCVHTSTPFDLVTPDGVRAFRSFVERAADLVVSYGGSLSGEHGDGQARGELLVRMFGEEIVTAFEELKAIFDPGDRMNPGKIVAPNPLDGELRLGTAYNHGRFDTDTVFSYEQDDGSFARAVLRCVGVGKCRHAEGGVMCPSYMVTKEEEHSTRGRARLLFEMLDGDARGGTIGDGWRSQAVADALDLCLACKGCKSDCPVNVDMATYKVEFLHHHYRHRPRPASHYSMGWLPAMALAASRAAGPTNALARAPLVGTLAKRMAGVDPRRELPRFAHEPFARWWRRHEAPPDSGWRGTVLLWPDTFTNYFHPAVARAAVELLEQAGWGVTLPSGAVCCGLTWISTGQLDTARRVVRRTARRLAPQIREGTRMVVLEPSCGAVFRSDAPELLPHDQDVLRLRDQTVTLAELLVNRTPGWQPPTVDRRVVVQTHCHQHAILGFDADRELLQRTGCELDVLDAGCCGLAGNFGFERGHYDVSVACAERALLPAVRDADPRDVVLADGFSCRTQLAQTDSGGRRGIHLAELLAGAPDDDGGPRPEDRWSPEAG